MSLSPLGFALIPLGLVLFVYGRRALMWATLAFVPFTTLEILDIGITTIAGFQFFGVLFIFRCFTDAVWSGAGGFRRSWTNALAAAFLAVCFLSLPMSALMGGAVDVYTETQGVWRKVVGNAQPLRLSLFNFTQIIYPIFGASLFCFLVRELKSKAALRKAIRILVWGAVVTAGFSVAAGVLFSLGQGNVYLSLLSLFEAGPLEGVKEPRAGSIGQFFRAYTPAGEPGFTALTLLIGIGLTIGSRVRRTPESSPAVRMPRLKLSVLTVALLLNGSTTGYFGVGLLVAWVIVAPWYVGAKTLRSFARPLVYAVGAVAIVGIAGTMIQVSGIPFYDWLTEYHLAKLQGEGVQGSGQIRWYVTWYTLTEVFLASPILGVGYGSHLSLSLATFLLSNVGLVGFGMFIAFLFVAFRHATRAAREANGYLGDIAFGAVLLFVPFFGTLFVAKATSAMNYGITWTVIALAEASYQVYRRRGVHQPV